MLETLESDALELKPQAVPQKLFSKEMRRLFNEMNGHISAIWE